MNTPRRTIPGRIGRILARVQHGVDSAFGWGVRALRRAGDEDGQERARGRRNKYVGTAEVLGRKVLGVVGDIGDEFYTEYERLKARRRPDSK